MKRKVYLVVLRDRKDTYIKVIDEEAWNWITSNDLGRPKGQEDESGWEDQLVPASQIEKMKKDGNYEPVEITRGSWQNDRAIACVSIDGYRPDYETIASVNRAIKKNGDSLQKEQFDGYMY